MHLIVCVIVCVCFFSQFLYQGLEVSVGGKKFQWFPKFILPLAELVKTTRKKTNVVHWSAEMYFDMGTAMTECFVLVEVAANGIKPGHSWWKKRWLVQKNQINLKSPLNWSFLHWVEKVWCTERRKRSTRERENKYSQQYPQRNPISCMCRRGWSCTWCLTETLWETQSSFCSVGTAPGAEQELRGETQGTQSRKSLKSRTFAHGSTTAIPAALSLLEFPSFFISWDESLWV